MDIFLNAIDKSWRPFFESHGDSVHQILANLSGSNFTPDSGLIFRAFRQPLNDIRVVIFGQDPYPGEGVADGLAFSSQPANSIPASLRNIFREYCDDLNLPAPTTPDLSTWSERGVMLLNRSLTTVVGERNAHIKKGWAELTYDVARLLGERGVVAILWGNNARELAPLFSQRIESVHPSPLSARNGFFGSQPFSRCNALLRNQGVDEINWEL
jgi:uracil-DNA glycosylase